MGKDDVGGEELHSHADDSDVVGTFDSFSETNHSFFSLSTGRVERVTGEVRAVGFAMGKSATAVPIRGRRGRSRGFVGEREGRS